MAPTQPLRILHVIATLGVGGCEKQLLELCRRLDRSRFDLHVCYYTPTSDTFERDFLEMGINVAVFDKFSMAPWSFFRRLRKAVKQVQPDIVHTWLYSANFWGRWAAAATGVRHIVSSERAEIQGRVLTLTLTEKLLGKRTLWTANSRAVAVSMKRFRGIPEAQVRVIPNAVDVCTPPAEEARRSVRAELGLAPTDSIVLMVANQSVPKNYPMFVRVAARVRRARPDVAFVGVGRNHLIDELRSLADQSGVPDAVRFAGPRGDVPRWLAAADVYCLTSSSEGFPNALLEAMDASLPVVSTALPGVLEVIGSSAAAVTVPPDDDEAMAARIVALLDDPAGRRSMGEAGHAHVRRHFGWDRLVQTMESLYLGLVGD